MQVRYRVNSAVVDRVSTPATLPNGQTVDAYVDGLTVEMVQIDGANTITLRFVPEDLSASQALFADGATIVADFSAE